MATEKPVSRMHSEFKRWLEFKGIDPNRVMTNYSIKHEDGQTLITFTMLADEFPVPAGTLLSDYEDETPQ